MVLPRGEKILDFTCGDKEFWIVNGNENFAYIKPAKAASQTNLNLITASGSVYSFVLVEVSNESNAEPDLKIFVEPKEDILRSATAKAPAFVSAQDVENYRQQVEIAKDETKRVKTAMQETIDRGISKFITNVRFPL
ncbi:MAG: TrbG/VirB9 family P-type conjugative transfer protein [Bryobacterales bacterium]|nr:TrbG/VirB9 family P-type conjugative transfer protein [Bryobacterales bacterium]